MSLGRFFARYRIVYLVGGLLLLLAPVRVLAGDKIAIMEPYVTVKMEQSKVDHIMEVIKEKIATFGKLTLNKDFFKKDLRFIQALESDSVSDIPKKNLSLPANYLLTSMIRPLGPNNYVLTFKLFDVEDDNIHLLQSQSEICHCEKTSLGQTTAKIADNMFNEDFVQHHMEDKIALQTANGDGGKALDRDGRFVAYDDGTVVDTKSGLMWAAIDNGKDIDWHEAKNFCESYTGAGYGDWRLPTRKELADLVGLPVEKQAFANLDEAPELTYLIRLTSCCPWSNQSEGIKALFYNFKDYDSYWDYQTNAYQARALPVRNNF